MKLSKFLLLAALVPITSLGSPIWTETFDYPDGSLTSVSGAQWTAFSGSGPIQVVNGRVFSLLASNSSLQDAQRPLDTTYSSGTLFAGFDLTATNTPIGWAYFALFKDSTASGLRGRVFLGAPVTSGFRIGLENDSIDGGATVSFTADLTLNMTYRVVIGYNTGTGTSRLWLDSTDELSPALQDNTAASLLGITGFALRQGGNAVNTYDGLHIDNIIVATDFLSAAVVPEPATFALLGLGGLAILLRRPK